MRDIIKWYKRYFTYVNKHRRYVREMCFRMGLYKQWLLHDLSKYLPCEFKSYMRYFSLWDKSVQDKFDYAWNHHLKNNKHHWQYRVLLNDDGSMRPLEMPQKYVLEMLCDWRWVGRAFMKPEDRYKYDVAPWFEVYSRYKKNREKIQLHNVTRDFIEMFLQEQREKFMQNIEWYEYEEWYSGRYKSIYPELLS